MKRSLLSSPLLLAALFSIGTANATILTFDGDICDGGKSCSNGGSIDQSYGDSGQLDVQYNRDITGSQLNKNLTFWTTDYNDLVNIAYGGYTDTSGVAEIFLKPSSGYSVTLNGFDLGAFFKATLNSQFTIVDGSSNTLFSSGTIPVGGGNTHSSYSVNYSSPSGIGIQWGPTAVSVGIDNVDFTVPRISDNTVPEPATLALIGVGLVGLGFSRRRRA